ncbi:MAG TPA: phage tail sheath C-terminal domain-containing protein [Burkholderiales bacterium]|nr:phage tail sheath C-terminal domain-containing protein [Burkholderiales bacterium]
MPAALTYPGVYIEEIPSGVHTITGVATSITAFVGRARRGPTDDAVTINSYGDFERVFGGLWVDSTLGYAVRDFFLNGGSQAVIVRLYHPKFATAADQTKAAKAASDTAAAAAGADAAAAAAAATAKAATYLADPEKSAAKVVADAAVKAAAVAGATVPDVTNAANAAAATAAPINKATLSANGLGLEAKYEGTWGNSLRARIDLDVVGPDAANLFNLSIRDGTTGKVELFRNVSVVPGHVRQVDKVLANDSLLVDMPGALPGARPAAHPAPDPALNESDVWADNAVATNSKVAAANQASDGAPPDVNDFTGPGKETSKEGLYALKKADLFNILCIPPYLDSGDVDNASLVGTAAAYCEQRRAILLVDPPTSWTDKDKAKAGVANIGTSSKNAALFFPRLTQPNPERDNQMEDFVPCGAIAGVFARTDTSRGVWKAPAGLQASLVSVPQLSVPLNDAENGELNPLGINCLRAMPAAGRIVWGSRTLQGDDRLASEWKYIPVRRTALYIEESLYRGTQWVVFEPNDEPLWAQIRLNVGAFMHNLFRQGAFQGTTPRDAYFVKCDKETTTQNDIDNGIVNIVVGFAPLKPAEFVVIKLQQIAGQIEV